MSNIEGFRRIISSSIDPLFLKSAIFYTSSTESCQDFFEPTLAIIINENELEIRFHARPMKNVPRIDTFCHSCK